MNYTATYSPDDNKLRLYATSRLDPETYERVRAAGFIYAPKQGLFVAPSWTPNREDLLIELAGEIDDEDTTLVARAEERAERFDDYKESRIEDAQRADKAVRSITEHIPFGQPILIGHHSERHARKDAERIASGTRKTFQMWSTARYWEDRAAGAIRHAKYKELPGVRHRRIKGLEADLRRAQNAFTPCPKTKPQMWEDGERVWITNGTRGGHWVKSALLPKIEAGSKRWMAHLENRIAYEKAMLGEAGGLVADRHQIEVGGKVLVRGEWVAVVRINRGANGSINSIRTAPISGTRGDTAFFKVESIRGYRAPEPGDVEKVKAATKLPPLCNYPGEGFRHMTRERLERQYHHIKTFPATATTGAYRTQTCFKGGGGLDCHNSIGVFLTDQKRKDPPALIPNRPALPKFEPEKDTPQDTDINPDMEASRSLYAEAPRDSRIPSYQELAQMKEAAKQGVAVVIVPQLIPTPGQLAALMVEEADIQPGQRILEPSAGTGALIAAMVATMFSHSPESGQIVAIEQNSQLATHLRRTYPLVKVANADFLACLPDASAGFGDNVEQLGTFDRVLMNPPFANAADIKHITHALRFLKPGGKLVAICANGPRQGNALRPIVAAHNGIWQELPADTFKDSGTGVRTVLLSIVIPAVESDPETDLRALWTAQGVPVEQQLNLLAMIDAAAAPGARVGPFKLRD
jgi:phospholipid N-methyltransferase